MGNYVSIADVRLEGVPGSVSDTLLTRRIEKWEKIVEQVCGQVFYEVSPGELVFDGNNAHIMHFGLPIISVASLKINGDDLILDPAYEYRVYSGRGVPKDDRRNPKIELTPIRNSVYRAAPSMFVKGLEQKITAKWGFLEPDDSTPRPIIDSVIQLVCLDVDGYFAKVSGGSTVSGGLLPVSKETTDGHSIEYMTAPVKLQWKMIPADIMDVLACYRCPLRGAIPEDQRWWYDPRIVVLSI